MLRTRFWGILLTVAGAATALAGQLQFTNTPLDTASLPRIAESDVGQKANDAEPVTLVVQFSRPIRPGDVEGLERAGATVHNYIPDYAYLVSASAGVAVQLGSLPGVAWAGLLPDYVKISKPLADRLSKSDASKAAASIVQYNVLSTDATGAKELEARGFRILDAHKTQMGWFQMRVDASLAKATDIAAVNAVFRVEAVPEYELHGERGAQTMAGNLNVGGTAPTGPGYTTWLSANGLSGGNDVIVQVQDDGLDKGIATNAAGTAHPDILGRIAGIFNATSDSLGDSKDGHGEINAGIIIGNASVGTTDGAGFKLGQGIAPQAKVYATKIFRNDFGPFDIGSNTLTDLARNAQNAGATFSNNSWGASVDGEYTTDSALYDALTRDADPNEAGNQPMVYFFSTGNDGPATQTIGSPATAKNVIAVGAAENSDNNGTDGCLVSASSSNSNRDIVDFSSRGPTEDSRFGVTVVATGTHVNGPASTAAGYNGLGVCDQYFPSGQTDYARSSGTSHSTPIATGAGIIIDELFTEQLSAKAIPAHPSPAMVRAILANTATSLQGGNDGDGGTIGHVPNPVQGWGSVNLGTLLSFKNSLYISDQETVFTATNQTHELLLTRKDNTKPIKITLAWSDAPGTPGTVALVNNLNLEVEDNGTVYKGNVFSNGASTTGGTADSRNTIEAVYLNNPSQNALIVRVKAANIAGNGIPNFGGSLDQDFALFATNATSQTFAGQIHMAPEVVSCDDTLTVTVSDTDLQGLGTIEVDLSTSTGDAETMTLTETAADSGIFDGTIDTSTGAPAANGVLQVSNGATITATYDDADNGTGSPAQVQDTSTADCAAPQITNVQSGNIFSNQATITFATNEAATSRVRYGTSCGALSQSVQNSTASTDHELIVSGLSAHTQYFFVVDATDTAGNSATANGGSCFTFTTTDRPDFFTEIFTDGSNDIDRQTLTFTPDAASISKYSVCKLGATLFPTDPNGGTVVNVTDDAFTQVTLTGGKTIPFYGVSYSSFFINSNGFVSFTEGSQEYAETFDLHFAQPRISGLFDDLLPSQTKPIRYQQLADRAVVTWVNVPEFGTTSANSFQIEMYFNGVIKITHLDIAAQDGLVGLSKGNGTPPDLVESDMSAYASCAQSFTLSGTVTEAAGGAAIAGVTISGLPGSPITNASGFYSVVVPGGFTGTAQPQKSGYNFSPSSRSYTNVSANATGQNFAGSQAVLSVSPLSQSIGAGAAELDFNVENNGAGTMNWTALVVLGTNWATLSGSPGTNNGTFRVSLQANNTGNSRETTVRVTSTAAGGSPVDISITQAPASNLAVTPPTRSVSFGAGNTTFSVANSGGGTLNWNATVLSGGDWLEITSGDSGTDSGTINLSFDKNTGAQRTGTVRVTSNATATSQVDVTVVQSPAPDLLVTPTHRDLTAGSGTTTFDVSFSGGTGNQWSAEVISGNWLGITSAESGIDAGQIELSYGSNSSDTARNATIRFTSPDVKNGPVDVTLTQNGFTSLKVVTPNGGEIVKIGKQLRIKWQSQGLTGTIRVELFKNGSFKKTILQGQLNDGRQRWRVDGVKKGTGYQVRVVSESNGVISDLSDSTFEIVK